MSIIGGLVDSHRETELEPSTRLITANWLARHLWVALAVAIVLALTILVR